MIIDGLEYVAERKITIFSISNHASHICHFRSNTFSCKISSSKSALAFDREKKEWNWKKILNAANVILHQ